MRGAVRGTDSASAGTPPNLDESETQKRRARRKACDARHKLGANSTLDDADEAERTLAAYGVSPDTARHLFESAEAMCESVVAGVCCGANWLCRGVLWG